MTALYPTLKPRVGEAPASVVSRLALLHRSQSVRTFALDMGFQQQEIVDGDRQALTRLASLVGVSLDDMGRWAITRHDDVFTYRGQAFSKSSLRRARQMACPHCLADDVASGPSWNISARSDWLFQHARICMKHQVELVCVAHTSDPSLVHDFARSAAPTIPRIPELVDEAIPRSTTSLERYIEARLDGSTGPAWLDSLQCYAAIRTCEVLGAVIKRGPDIALKSLSDQEWREAGQAGFELAAQGPEHIQVFLQELWKDRRSLGQGAGPQVWFNALFKWLYALLDDRAYDPVRDLIVQFVADHAPVSPEDELFGRQIVQERRIHSVHTASRETGLHHKRLRRVLRCTGVLTASSDELTDNMATFPLASAEPAFDMLRNALTQTQVQAYLNAGRVPTQILVQSNIVQPIADHETLGLGDWIYDRRELDRLMGRLLLGAEPIAGPSSTQLSISAAAKRACCSMLEIVRPILDRRLAWTGRLIGETGYNSILVDADEIKALTRGDHGDNLTLHRAAKMLGTTDKVLNALVANSLLPTRDAISPLNRCPYVSIQQSDLAQFRHIYVSLYELAQSLGQHMLNVKRRLAELGVNPAIDPALVHARFYLRAEIPTAL